MKRKSMKRKMTKKGRKASRRRRMRGGVAPPSFSHTSAMPIQLAQGQQFAKFHENQHGGALAYGDYPGAIGETLPSDLAASAKLTALNQSFDYIKQFGPSSDNPNLSGGRRRRSSRKSKKSRKSRKSQRKSGGFLGNMQATLKQKAMNYAKQQKQKAMNYAKQQASIMQQQAMNYAKQQAPIMQQQAMNYAKQQAPIMQERTMRYVQEQAAKRGIPLSRRNRQRGGLYRWGGGSKKLRGGSYAEMRFPMSVADESKMLIPPSLEAQAGLNPEWKLAKDPMSFAPNM